MKDLQMTDLDVCRILDIERGKLKSFLKTGRCPWLTHYAWQRFTADDVEYLGLIKNVRGAL